MLARYVQATAPAGLALVQGLLNTRATASGAPDLLATTETAQTWLDAGLPEWAARTGSIAPHIRLSPDRLLQLRALRERVRRFIGGERAGVHPGVGISIIADPDGTLRAQPVGADIEWIESAVWGAILMAQTLDTLRRLKLCRNELCGSAFYDRSKPNNGVWHDVHVCGNSANLRASRARKKSAQRGGTQRGGTT
jgi:hypothetical protein